MKLRALTEADRGRYTALLLLGLRENLDCFRITETDVRNHPSPLVSAVDAEEFTLGAFIEEDEPAGVVSFAREKGSKMRHKGLIFRMYVPDRYAGQGLGRALMQEAMRRGAALPGLEQIQLTVLSANARAKHLYLSLGFVGFSVEKDAVKWGGKRFDEERLVWNVPAMT